MQNLWLNKKLKVLGLIGFSFVIILIVFNVVRGIFGPDQKKILQRLKSEFVKIDKLANASIVSENYIAAVDKTSIEIKYITPLTDKEVQGYYDDELRENGWILVEQEDMHYWGRDLGGKIFTYNKSDLLVSMQYAGDGKRYGWVYNFFMKPK